MTFTLEQLKTEKGDGKPFEQLPEGDYKATLIQYTEKPNKKNTGTVGKLEFALDEKDSKGEKRKVADFLNVEHNNPVAVQISGKRLFNFLTSVGADDATALGIVNSKEKGSAIESDYCYKPVVVSVKHDVKGDKTYLNITGYKAV